MTATDLSAIQPSAVPAVEASVVAAVEPSAAPAAEASAAPAVRAPRVESIDVLRGVIIVLMALDHTRDFFGQPGVSPTDLRHASAALFLTRWVTHFCAPVFFLLTGTGAFLALRRRSRAELSRYLVVRGAGLLVLDVFVVRCFGLQFNLDYRVTLLIVLWALGWAMIVLAALIHLPMRAILAFAVVLIAGHNALDGVRPAALGAFAPLWSILHVPGVLFATPRFMVLVGYPLIPWVGVTAAGYVLGQTFRWPAERRRPFLLRLGLALTAAFVVLRALGVYGDPSPWTPQGSPLRTALAFLNLTKYPPSLLFLLMTLGPALLLLAALDRGTPAPLRPVLAYGRVPLFFYVTHLPLIHLAVVALCLARYGDAHWMFQSPRPDLIPFTPPPGWGVGLPVVYLIWAAVVLALYPACRWLAGVKRRSGAAWLSYF